MISTYVTLIKRAISILKDDGPWRLAISGFSFFMRPVSNVLISIGIWLRLLSHKSYNELNRTDSDFRWSIIEPHLKSAEGSCLDIGCADGFFSAKAAVRGLYTIGIDNSVFRIENARKIHRNVNKCMFMCESITPQNIGSLPKTDVVLLLTVFHHWCDAFGNESAKEMMRTLATNSRKIVFEPPGTQAGNFYKISNERPLAPDHSSIDYYEELLEEIYNGNVTIELLGQTSYNPTVNRRDPIFLIDCTNYAK
jgi:SAM-dependent methyltransferase